MRRKARALKKPRSPARCQPGRPRVSRLTIPMIRGWAKAHFGRTGRWPTLNDGPVREAPDENWGTIANALRYGRRGLSGGQSLARLFGRNPHRARRPRLLGPGDEKFLDENRIFGWAAAHFRRTGFWPTTRSGAVIDADGENWTAINGALSAGYRGLPGGSSITKLLNARRIIRPRQLRRPALTRRQVLEWAETYFKKYGHWPYADAEPIEGAPGETWFNIDGSLRKGLRGLPGGLSLKQLLLAAKGVKVPRRLWRPLTVEQILAWADAFYKRRGSWPRPESGPIPGAPRETWHNVDVALLRRLRGLSEKSSLFRLLQKHRGAYRGKKRRPYRIPESRRLTIRQIKAWAKEQFRRTGVWPHATAGPVPGRDDLNWRMIDNALRKGLRGLPGESSLSRLFGRKPRRRELVPRARRRG